MLKLTTDSHEASRGLFATAELVLSWLDISRDVMNDRLKKKIDGD